VPVQPIDATHALKRSAGRSELATESGHINPQPKAASSDLESAVETRVQKSVMRCQLALTGAWSASSLPNKMVMERLNFLFAKL